MVYTSTWFTYSICFFDVSSPIQQKFDIFVDLCFVVDILLTFNTAWQIDEIYEYNRTIIAKQYAKSWLGIDVSSVIGLPLHGIDSGSTEVVRTVKVLKFPKLLRLIRVFNVIKILKVLKHKDLIKGLFSDKIGTLSQFVQQSLKNTGILLFSTHLMACFWFLQAKNQSFPDDSWVVRGGHQYETPGKLYLISCYWAVSTATTTGFGDINANGNIIERIMAVCWIGFAIILQARIIGNSISLERKEDS